MLWNSFQTDAYSGMTAETVGLAGHDGKPIHAYYSRPLGEGPFPGILLIHHMPGWDEYTREAARRLAEHGYSVLCPNLYEDFGHGTPEEVAERAKEAGGMDDKNVMGDCDASLRFLRNQPNFSGKVGVIGMCSGGAAHLPGRLHPGGRGRRSGLLGRRGRVPAGEAHPPAAGAAPGLRGKPPLPPAGHFWA